MPVPPLRHCVLHAGIEHVALRAHQRHRDRQVVDDVQHGDGDDEGEIEPVRHIDVRLAPPRQRADIDEEIDDPDQGQPQIHVPLRLGIFLRLGDAEQVSGGGKHNEELVAPEHEPGRPASGKTRAARALHDIERARDQHIAAEGEDHRGGMQRPQAAEARPFEVEIEDGIGKLPGDEVADEKPGDAPDHRGDDAGADDPVGIAGLIHRRCLTPEPLKQIDPGHGRGDHQDRPGQHHARVSAGRRPGKADHGANGHSEQRRSVRKGVQFLALHRCRHARSAALGFAAPWGERPIPTLTRIKSRGRIVRRSATLNGQCTLPCPRRSRAAGLGPKGVDFAREASMIWGIAL